MKGLCFNLSSFLIFFYIFKMIDEYQASGIHDSFRRRRKTDTPFMTGKNKKEPVQSPLFPQPNVDQKVKSTKKSVVDPSDESEDDLYFYKKSSLSSQGKAGHKIHPLDLIDTESDADHKIRLVDKSAASYSDEEDPADKSAASSRNDDDQHDPADKKSASESSQSSDDSHHPSAKKINFSSLSTDDRCHEIKKKRKLRPNKNRKIDDMAHFRSNTRSDI